MRKAVRRIALSLLLVASSISVALAPDAPPMTFIVQSEPSHSVELSAAKLKVDFAADVKAITYTSRGESHTANAIPLLAVLRSAGVPTELKMDPAADPKTKNLPLRMTVIVTGRDGYAASFGLGELLPDIGNREVWIALDRDGAALAERSAPVELVVPADVKAGRWVRGISMITVERPSATPP